MLLAWVAWEEYRDTFQMCRDRTRKAKVQMVLDIGLGMKKHKGFFKYSNWVEEAEVLSQSGFSHVNFYMCVCGGGGRGEGGKISLIVRAEQD